MPHRLPPPMPSAYHPPPNQAWGNTSWAQHQGWDCPEHGGRGKLDDALNCWRRCPTVTRSPGTPCSAPPRRQLFDSVPFSRRNLFSWTAMISCYLHKGRSVQALNLFRHHYGVFFDSGILPILLTFSILLKACGLMRCPSLASQIHCLELKLLNEQGGDWIFVENTLIDVYAKLGSLVVAEGLFTRMKHKDLATMNTMMDAYTVHLLMDKAIGIFDGTEQKDALSWSTVMSGLARRHPDSSTYTVILGSCAALARTEFGRQVHAYIVKYGLYCDPTPS